MIEIKIREFLEKKLQVQVFLEHQPKMPENFVIFEKVGSNKKNYINTSSFAFQSYGKSLYEAAKLNEKLKEVVETLVELEEIMSVKLDSDYNFTDTETKRYRYQAVYEIKY